MALGGEGKGKENAGVNNIEMRNISTGRERNSKY
jgi:hypothetical protein